MSHTHPNTTSASHNVYEFVYKSVISSSCNAVCAIERQRPCPLQRFGHVTARAGRVRETAGLT